MSDRVLLVDDERPFLDVLAPFLERAGFGVKTAQDGEAALRRLARSMPDAIVLDVAMPHVDGREVCRRLRVAGNWTPVIMLTQVGSPTERAMSLEEGADDYINKLFDPAELVARLRPAAGQHWSQPSPRAMAPGRSSWPLLALQPGELLALLAGFWRSSPSAADRTSPQKRSFVARQQQW